MGRRSEPFAPGRPRRADVVVAAVSTVATVVLLVLDTAVRGPAVVWTAWGTWWNALILLVAVTVAWRRRRPLIPVVTVLVAISTAPDSVHESPMVVVGLLAWCVIVASAVLHGSAPTLVGAGLATAAVVLTAVVVVEPSDAAYPLIFPVPVAVGAVVRWARLRRRRRELAVRRRDWDDEQRAVEQERTRMARELHDIVAHHVSGIVVSGGAALRILDRDPHTARDTLRTIAESAERTTHAMHRMITHGDDGADITTEKAQPGLPDLHDLAERFTRTGCRIELLTTGDLRAVPPDAGLSAYRIVQECLTNSLKHAGPVAVTVRVDRGPDDLVVRVDDEGRAADGALAPLPGTGQGLVGMAERVAIFGGTLAYGPRLSGGWSVDARLPLGRSPVG